MNIKNVPKKAARIVANQTLETLKRAREQVTATGEYSPNKVEEKSQGSQQVQEPDIETEKARAQRHYQAYQAELEEIAKRQKLEEQRKKELENLQEQQEPTHLPKPVPQISSVPSRGRGRFFGIKKKISELGKTVEIRKPSST